MDREKAEFATRLRKALQDKGMGISAAALEKRFNSRYAGAPVTTQAISGWLTGRYIPRQDKLRVLASILGMDPQVLQYGAGRAAVGGVAEERMPWPAGVGAHDREVIDAFLALPPKRRELVGELVAALGAGKDK